jgi:sugar phosphate isomerase/epimerase
MTANRRRVSLAHLTVLDAPPVTLVDAAAAGGFDSIGLRLVAPMPTDRIFPVVGDEAEVRRTAQRLADTGVDILDIEAIWLTAETAVESYVPVFEIGARLGARNVLVVGNDPHEHRVTATFAALCATARPFGLKVMLEFIPYCHTSTVEAGHRVVTHAGQPNAGVLVDALHLSRSGGSPADIRRLDPTWLTYVQICDARQARPVGRDALRSEAREGRLYPGEGTLPLTELLDALAPGTPLGVEAPCAELGHLPPIERALRCGAATRAFLTAYDARKASTA